MNSGQQSYDNNKQNKNIKINLQKFFDEQNHIQNTCSDNIKVKIQGANKTINGIKQKKMHVF